MTTYNGENIHNNNLFVILQQLNKIMPTTNVCKCEICLGDICALALTKLPPSYSTNLFDRDTAIQKIDAIAIAALVEQCIEQVSSNPHH